MLTLSIKGVAELYYFVFLVVFGPGPCNSVYGHALLPPNDNMKRLRLELSNEKGAILSFFAVSCMGTNKLAVDVGVEKRPPSMPPTLGNFSFRRGWSTVTAIASPMSISPNAHDRPKITHMTTSGIFKLKKRTTIGAVDI
jgi:hypothetical protein